MTVNELIVKLEMLRDLYGGDTETDVEVAYYYDGEVVVDNVYRKAMGQRNEISDQRSCGKH